MVGLTLTGVPLVAAMLPGVITPGPPLNAGIKLELDPASMVEGLPAKPLISWGGPVLVVELPLPQPAKSKTATVAISATITDAVFRFMTASICPTELEVMDGSISSRSGQAAAPKTYAFSEDPCEASTVSGKNSRTLLALCKVTMVTA